MFDYDKVPARYKLKPTELTEVGCLHICRYWGWQSFVAYPYIIGDNPPLYQNIGVFEDFEDAYLYALAVNDVPDCAGIFQRITEGCKAEEDEIAIRLMKEIRAQLHGKKLADIDPTAEELNAFRS